MPRPTARSITALIGVFALFWLSLKYILPVILPFLMGAVLALAAEPLVRLLAKRLPRGAAAGIGVTATLVLLSCVLLLLTALVVKELGRLAGALPDLGQTAMQGIAALENFLMGMVQRAPESIRPMLTRTVEGLFSGSSAIVDEITRRIPGIASSILGHVPGSALTIGTGILSGFMLSARLPRIRQWLRAKPFMERLRGYIPAFKKLRTALAGWLKAQLKLSGVCFAILTAGLLLLRIPYAPLWAVLIALVDAVPVLGTGTVLLPWSLICLIQGQQARAVGLLGIYAVTFLSRTTLEPRLVGRHLGLDPLVTLLCLYVGYRLWGIGGMLLSPLLSVAAKELSNINRPAPQS